MTNAERYLRKARESLASAKADALAERYNSAANRGYYACFQAAVAALLHWNIRGMTTNWEHRFVAEEFADKLVRRRKLFAHGEARVLNDFFAARIVGDYRERDISRFDADGAVALAERFVAAVGGKMGRNQVADSAAEYGAMKTKPRDPMECVEEVKQAILRDFPDVEIMADRRNERDFTLDVWGIEDGMRERFSETYDLVTDILIDDDVWVVVIPLPRNEPDD